MTPNIPSSKTFHRTKLLLFKFLAHQYEMFYLKWSFVFILWNFNCANRIHPFAYAVNTFLQPALDDCRKSLHDSPEDTFNILLSISQTFIRFAPDSALIYDDIQQFASNYQCIYIYSFVYFEIFHKVNLEIILTNVSFGLILILFNSHHK